IERSLISVVFLTVNVPYQVMLAPVAVAFCARTGPETTRLKTRAMTAASRYMFPPTRHSIALFGVTSVTHDTSCAPAAPAGSRRDIGGARSKSGGENALLAW